MYKALLIDIDNTLLDFPKCAENAMRLAFEEHGLSFTDDVPEKFHIVNNELWGEIEKGTLTREGLSLIRWNRIFALLGIEYDGVRTEETFKKYLAYSADKIDGADEILQYLKTKNYLLAAASNGPLKEQVSRLKTAGIYGYFDYVFVSEEIGCSKPDKRFFDECVRRLSVQREDILMIGDSVNADILGAKNSGIKTCFYDYSHTGDSGLSDLYISKLSDLKLYL